MHVHNHFSYGQRHTVYANAHTHWRRTRTPSRAHRATCGGAAPCPYCAAALMETLWVSHSGAAEITIDLNIHHNADVVELQLSAPHTHNTFGWLFQLGLAGALLLFCTDSSFHRVRRDKNRLKFSLCCTHLKPLHCEKSFNAVPLRRKKNNP